MHEFAPSKSRPSGKCPSPLELAAYIDGTLGKEEAARVAEHISSCERCFEVYSETIDFQLKSEPVPAGEVVPFPSDRKKPYSWWLAAAAMLLLGVGVVYTYRTLTTPPPTFAVAEIAPDLRGRSIQEDGVLWEYNRYRGREEGESEASRQSFQVGALLLDFHLRAQAGDAAEGSETWRQIGAVVRDVTLAESLGGRILREANQIKGSGASLSAIASRLPETEAELANSALFPEYMDLGKWTEAGRIAAVTGDSAFFEDHENRRFLRYALKKWQPEKPENVRRELQKIAEIWDQGELSADDRSALAEHFHAILEHYDF